MTRTKWPQIWCCILYVAAAILSAAVVVAAFVDCTCSAVAVAIAVYADVGVVSER